MPGRDKGAARKRGQLNLTTVRLNQPREKCTGKDRLILVCASSSHQVATPMISIITHAEIEIIQTVSRYYT